MTPNKIICGSALEVLKDMPDESINCSISSPPYWGLRAYNTKPQIWGGSEGCEHRWGELMPPMPGGAGNKPDKPSGFQQKSKAGQTGVLAQMKKAESNTGQFCSLCGAWRGELGLEPTIELYIDHLCTIYDEVKRVLRKDGTCWVNLGDSYGGSGGEHKPWHKSDTGFQHNAGFSKHCLDNEFFKPQTNIPAKSLCLIPQRFAIEMVNRGWILRNVIIWSKPNPMPSSAKDRFTVDFEYVFFMVRSKSYFFEPQYEPHITADDNRPGRTMYAPDNPDVCGSGKGRLNQYNNPLGRNKRTTWTIPTEAFPEAHFATFPRKLVEPMIKAGCPRYVCTKCGTPRRKVYDIVRDKTTQADSTAFRDDGSSRNFGGERWISHPVFKGYSTCGCENPTYKPGIVLDMFGGSCTTGVVAYEHGRDYIIVELSPEYAKMGEKRITKKTEQYSLIER